MQTKRLLLLRHAKAEQNIEIVDWLRPLKKRGKRAATHMGQWLAENKLQPDLIISSPAKRAINTAKKICEAMDINPILIRQDDRLYNATIPLMQKVLQDCPAEINSILLVGHNPALEDFLTDLVNTPIDETDDGKLLPTAALAHLELTVPWAKISSNTANLISIKRVKEI